ncbi:unnamed protein product [Auanema sp. JU1783]|nr:unnamed protein product [Auanema sp. JU1783]
MTAHDVRPKSKTSNRQETVRVIVRCRPLSTTEISQGHSSIVSLYPERGLIELKNPSQPDELSKDFTFDAIYGASSKQKDLYDETFRDLVDSVLNGFNGTIFAYGQTGTGKTYTMEGKASIQDERGVIYNCFDHIFQHISQSRNQKYLVRASYLEIYQEEIRDLLDKDGKKLELKERPDVGVYVKDLSSSVTKSVEELKSVMLVGNANRSVGRTNMNEHSSRSHAIFMVTIECCEVGIDGENHIRVGRLNLVDLAGSERQAKTGASGERFKEATKINLSLSALGNVISSLVDGKSSHIPYRDSKLTRLLQDSLGGNSKTVMVACIGPASYNYEETLGTLRYANRAKNIKNKPRINEDPKDALLREFQDEINRLRAMLTAKKGTKGTDGARGDEYYNEQHRNLEADKRKILSDDSIVKEERKRILEALDKRSRELNAEKDSQAKMSEKIKAMESKLLGGTNLLDHTREQESLLEHQRKELADQKRKEREILEILEQQDEGTAEIHQTFTNLQQEVDAKTKKLNKFKLKLRKLRNEIHDTAIAHSQERQELERDVSEINKELKLKLLIVDNFVPNDVRQRVKELAVWSEEDSIWNLPGARPLSGTSRPSTSDAKGNILVVDGQGVFTRSTGNDSGVGSNTSSSSVSKDDYLDRRPVSIPGLRRPMSSYEKLMVEQAREQMSGQRRPFINSNHPVEPKLNEDIIRFCGENVLVFSSLERLYPNVMDYYEDSSNALGATPILESNVVIDASKSSPSHFSRLRSPSVDSRSRSKNGDARNALPKTHASMYPKARGLV